MVSMAKGTEPDEFRVLSRVRVGLKREFAFALKVQSEISGSLGRTRATKNRNVDLENPGTKKLKGLAKIGTKNGSKEDEKSSKAEKSTSGEVPESDKARVVGDIGDEMSEEAKSDVLDLVSDDEPKGQADETLGEAKSKDEKTMLICEEEVKGEVLENEEMKSHEMVDMVRDKELVDDKSEAVCEVEPNKDVEMKEIESRKFISISDSGEEDKGALLEEGAIGVTPILVEADKVEDMVVEKPPRRFTRSALKQKPEITKTFATTPPEREETCTKVVTIGDEAEADDVNNFLVSSQMKLDTTTSKKKVTGKKFPAKLKDLIDTGLLEGLPVRYIRGAKARESGDKGLQGVIKGSGVSCFCDICKGNEVVTPTVFELHAGSTNKRPPEYTYLENGNTLRDVMNACQNSPLDTLEEAVKSALGCFSTKKSTVCLSCKGRMRQGSGKSMLLCDSCIEFNVSQPIPVHTANARYSSAHTTNSRHTPGHRANNRPSPDQTTIASDSSPKVASFSQSSDRVCKSSKSNSARSKSHGRLTRKDLRLHKLVFEEDVLPDGTEVAYYTRGQKLLVGYKKGFGIVCSCCNAEVSPSQFEAHAGWASRRKPYLHIYTSNGVSLHELSISLSRGRKFSSHENDDLCSICADGGDLLCCDGCPRSFHTDCITLPSIPTGTWYCKYCQNLFQKEKFVERNANAVAAGRVAGVDPIEQITKRCIRIVKNIEVDVGGCALCRSPHFSKSAFGPRTVILCDQCEREFHVGCLKDYNMEDLKELPEGNWFCSADCNRIRTALEKLVLRGEEKLPDSFLIAVRKKIEEKGSESMENLDIRWRVLNLKMALSDETKKLLSKAVTIFHDCFDPIVDSASGRDFIPSMLYGRSIRGQEFGGIYCAILTVNQSVVSVGIFRIFGAEVAELPLVATNTDFQGQGYFQALFSCIERFLGFLKVKNLVLPAAEEAESIWINKFGFSKLTPEEINEYKKHYQMMIFQETPVLQKAVPGCRVVDAS